MRLLLTLAVVFTTDLVYAQQPIIVSFISKNEKQLLDGRLILMLSKNKEQEPRFQITDGPETQIAFGVDIENWNPGTSRLFSTNAFGYPIERMRDIPAGEYYIQALLHRYETFHRKDGHTVKLPMDRGEGQQWNLAPGNLYSKPMKIKYDPKSKTPLRVVMNQEIPPIEPPKDTKYVKHLKIQSKLLTEFWGRPMFLGAHILLPEGFDEHTQVKYPLAIFHGHFPSDFGGWRTTAPDPELKPDYSERFNITGYNKIMQQEAYDFYKIWTGPKFPRVLAIEIQHACPYYDDSYAVNSENVGPYGDAIMYELIPEIEKRFRGIGEGWSRFMYGGSTGGWEVLATQVFYPDEFNGCYAACPDPIDFRAFTSFDLYKEKNAYFIEGAFKKVARPGHRNYLGQIQSTIQDLNYRELMLGNHSRSGQQWDIWEAVASPVDTNGYPKRIYNKYTGEINKEVANYWKEHYDLSYIMKRDWPKIGEKLKGKIHIYCGDMDNYYLNNAVYLTEAMLKELNGPAYHGEVDYGDRAEHCWNGDHTQPNYISRLRYHRMFITKWADEMKQRVPAGADTSSWRY